MLRRYLLPCALVMAVSIGTAGLAYKAARNKDFAANCSFQAVISLGQGHPLSKDAVDAYNSASVREVSVARVTDVFSEVAKTQKVSASALSGRTSVGPFVGGLGAFLVNVADTDPKRAVTLANATCDQFVASIQKRRTAEVAADVKTIEVRIAGIEAELARLVTIPKKRRTTKDLAEIVGQLAARKGNVDLLANTLSLPPDEISVLTRATGVTGLDKRSLSKNLIIALVAGLLVCFLIVLVGETIAESRKRGLSETS